MLAIPRALAIGYVPEVLRVIERALDLIVDNFREEVVEYEVVTLGLLTVFGAEYPTVFFVLVDGTRTAVNSPSERRPLAALRAASRVGYVYMSVKYSPVVLCFKVHLRVNVDVFIVFLILAF